jgi:hypothetical protein
MTRHRFQGDPARFEVVARFIADRFPDARYIADVAGGQGMLTRILRKRFGFEAEVIDPRGWAQSARKVAVLVVPCCNFWTRDRRLGRAELIEQISDFHHSLEGISERVTLAFSGPANRGLILRPPQSDEGVRCR